MAEERGEWGEMASVPAGATLEVGHSCARASYFGSRTALSAEESHHELIDECALVTLTEDQKRASPGRTFCFKLCRQHIKVTTYQRRSQPAVRASDQLQVRSLPGSHSQTFRLRRAESDSFLSQLTCGKRDQRSLA
jgi:hypothetical protein